MTNYRFWNICWIAFLCFKHAIWRTTKWDIRLFANVYVWQWWALRFQINYCAYTNYLFLAFQNKHDLEVKYRPKRQFAKVFKLLVSKQWTVRFDDGKARSILFIFNQKIIKDLKIKLDKVFKSGSSKIFKRLSSTNFTWSPLDYFVRNAIDGANELC